MIDNISQVTLNFVAVVTCATPCLPLQLAYRSHEVARQVIGHGCLNGFLWDTMVFGYDGSNLQEKRSFKSVKMQVKLYLVLHIYMNLALYRGRISRQFRCLFPIPQLGQN